MSSLNDCNFIGNLGADPESRTTGNGNTVTNFRLAVNERTKDRDGNWTERTEWVSVVCWGRTAENVARFCQKGRQVYVKGRLQTRKWQDKSGADRYSTEIVANDVKFLGGKDGGSGGGGSYGGYGSGYRDEPQVGGPPSDDIPF